MSDLLGRGDPRIGDLSKFDADRLQATLRPLLARANGVSWYSDAGTDVDLATARLCLLRRARAGMGADAQAGDAAVRTMLSEVDEETLVWLLSRAISFMDEQGFPELVPGARFEE